MATWCTGACVTLSMCACVAFCACAVVRASALRCSLRLRHWCGTRYLPAPSAESAVDYQLGANSPRMLEVRVADSPVAASSCSLRLPSNMPCHHCSFMRLNSLGTQSCVPSAVWTTEAAVIIRVEAESIGKRGCGLVSSQAAPQRVYSGLFVSRRCCT